VGEAQDDNDALSWLGVVEDGGDGIESSIFFSSTYNDGLR
jgi:hypothetical protein